MIEIDGSYGEGGGQMIRTASALSVLTGKSFHMFNIRSNRPAPGLRTQHLKSIMTCAEMCSAKLENAEIASRDVVFEPGEFFEGEKISMEIETAGSIGLVLQMLTPVVMKAGKRFRMDINGGAVFGKYAPPLQYIQQVILPIIRRMGYDISIDIIRYGFYPSGGAKVVVIFNPPTSHLSHIKMETVPSIESVNGISVSTRELRYAKIAERTRAGVHEFMKENAIDCEIKTVYCEANNTGSGLVLYAKANPIVAIGSDGLGSPSLKPEFLGRYTSRAIVDLINTGCPVDTHAADQLLLFMALAKGRSVIKTPQLTEHAKTNMFVIQKFLDVEFSIEEDENSFVIACDGCSYKFD
jgi:RNA 3'-phosphate cyclase